MHGAGISEPHILRGDGAKDDDARARRASVRWRCVPYETDSVITAVPVVPLLSCTVTVTA